MSFSFFRIRDADDADLALLDSLAQARGYTEDHYFARCLKERELGRRLIFMAETASGEGAGYVMLNRFSRYQPFRSLNIPEIQDLFVVSQYRRQGTGKALVDACEAAAKMEREAEQGGMIGLAVGLHAAYGAAQRLYTRLGYLPDGFGLVYDCEPVQPGTHPVVDDHLCLMMVKDLVG